MPFQNKVNIAQAPAVEGDFASSNPTAVALTIPGGFVTAPVGVRVGRFGWVAADGITVSNFAQGAVKPTGFVHRKLQALITLYLAETSMVIPAGFPVALFNTGDFWAKVAGSTAATPGAQAFANYTDGSVSFGSAPTGASGTGSIGSTFTATATGNSLAVTVITGYLSIGDTISGTGVPAGTTIIAQTAGTTGSNGTYTTSVVTTAAAATVTSFGIVLNVTAATGTFIIGDAVTGTGVPAGATIGSQTSGTIGGIGIYTLNVAATAYAASTALTVIGGIATSFYAKTNAAIGELVKISTYGN